MSRFWNKRNQDESESGRGQVIPFQHELLKHVQLTSQAADQVSFIADQVVDLVQKVKVLEQEKTDLLARLEKLEASQDQ